MVNDPQMPFKEGWSITELFSERGWVWMQFTGLKDRNGKEIYEGDVVEKKQGESVFRYEVRSYLGAFGIEFPAPSYSFKPFCELPNNYEIIGNIYENPELLNHET